MAGDISAITEREKLWARKERKGQCVHNVSYCAVKSSDEYKSKRKNIHWTFNSYILLQVDIARVQVCHFTQCFLGVSMLYGNGPRAYGFNVHCLYNNTTIIRRPHRTSLGVGQILAASDTNLMRYHTAVLIPKNTRTHLLYRSRLRRACRV